MKTLFAFVLTAAVVAISSQSIHGASAPASKAPKATPAKAKAGAGGIVQPKVPVVTEIPKSVFVVPANPREGRNPFFPGPAEVQKPAAASRAATADNFALVLNGLSGPPKRTAMINGRTFEAGEKGEVKLADGSRLQVECVEVRDDSAMISVGGQTRELRLRGY